MSITDYLLIGILLIVFIRYYFVNVFHKTKRYWFPYYSKHRDDIWKIPGPVIVPFLGTKWIFVYNYKFNKLHEAYEDLNRKYGDIVLEVTPTSIPIVHLFNRNDIEKVLKYPSKYPFRPPTEIAVYYRKSRPDRYASGGIVNEQGEKWHHLKSSITPHLTSPKVLQGFLPALNLICNDFIELLKYRRSCRPDQTTTRTVAANAFVENFQDITNLMGLEAMCALMLGRRMGFLTIDTPKNARLLANAVRQLFVTQRDSYYGMGLWKYFPTRTYREFSESEEIIYNIVSDIIDNTDSNSSTVVDDDDLKSVFRNILNTKNLDIRDKKSAIIDFVAAGIETLASTLIFTLNYITKEPGCVQRIRDEFDSPGDIILQEDLSKATYTKACIHEAYRLQPTAFCLARLLEEDTELSGYNVKAGTIVLCQTMIACRKEENFKDAKQFRPQRWLENNNLHARSELGSSIIVPFGAGKRTCPGRRFVALELLMLIAKLCRAFDIEFEREMETECEFLLVAKAPVNLILRDAANRHGEK